MLLFRFRTRVPPLVPGMATTAVGVRIRPGALAPRGALGRALRGREAVVLVAVPVRRPRPPMGGVDRPHVLPPHRTSPLQDEAIAPVARRGGARVGRGRAARVVRVVGRVVLGRPVPVAARRRAHTRGDAAQARALLVRRPRRLGHVLLPVGRRPVPHPRRRLRLRRRGLLALAAAPRRVEARPTLQRTLIDSQTPLSLLDRLLTRTPLRGALTFECDGAGEKSDEAFPQPSL